MYSTVLTAQGTGKFHCLRLRRGQDLMEQIKALCREKRIGAGVVLSGVGCLLRARLRDASGVTIRQLEEHLEIVSLNGTVSQARCHLHISLSKEDLSTVGGHLCPGCIVNTTCELVILELPDIAYGVEADPETGYDEIVFTRK